MVKKVILLTLIMFFGFKAFAKPVGITCSHPGTREDGTEITGEFTFELWANGVLLESKSECDFNTDITVDTTFTLYAVEDGLRNLPEVINFTLPKSPPARVIINNAGFKSGI